MICAYCKKDTVLPCKNTRDMEDAAISGDLDCLEVIVRDEIGEKGSRYCVLNFIDHMRNWHKHQKEIKANPPE